MIVRRLCLGLLLLFPIAVANANPALNSASQQTQLEWPPPVLANPITIHMNPNPVNRVLRLDYQQDYIVEMPNEPVIQGLVLQGGRNVVLVGGEISIPWQGNEASISKRTGLKIVGTTGIVHIEGLVISGDDLSEGIQIDAPQAIVQIQNAGIYDIHARDQINFSDNHPDLIQAYGGVTELRVDRFTGSSDYQGFFFEGDVPFSAIYLKRVNIRGNPTARYLMWFGPGSNAGSIYLKDVWISIPVERNGGLGKSVWPDIHGDYPTQAQIADVLGTNVAFWPVEMNPKVYGMVFEGIPPGGDYVIRDQIGIHYRSSGSK
jgi:hypothetical protein